MILEPGVNKLTTLSTMNLMANEFYIQLQGSIVLYPAIKFKMHGWYDYQIVNKKLFYYNRLDMLNSFP